METESENKLSLLLSPLLHKNDNWWSTALSLSSAVSSDMMQSSSFMIGTAYQSLEVAINFVEGKGNTSKTLL